MNLEFNALFNSFERFSSELESFYEKENKDDRNINNLLIHKKRLESVQNTIKSISAIDLQNISVDDLGLMELNLEINKNNFIIKLTEKSKVDSIKVLSNDLEYIDTSKIINESNKMESPSELRYAINCLLIAPEAKKNWTRDIASLKKKVIIKRMNNWTLQLTFQSGLTAVVEAHHCYSFVPACVKIISIHSHDESLADKLSAYKDQIQTKEFLDLLQITHDLNNISN